MVNPRNPGADFEADRTGCQRDAEIAAKLRQLSRPAMAPSPSAQQLQRGQAEDFQAMQDAVSIEKRCMADKGWRAAP
jgi:hypothetical protein